MVGSNPFETPPGVSASHGVNPWFWAQNQESFPLPAFGLVGLPPKSDINPGAELFSPFGYDKASNRHFLKVMRPTAYHATQQNAATLAVAGPVSIPPKGWGKVTMTYPARVLHDGSQDALPNGVSCGPLADQPWVSSDGVAFTCIGHELESNLRFGDGLHLVWIRPNTRIELTSGGWSGTGKGLVAGDSLVWNFSVIQGSSQTLLTRNVVDKSQSGITLWRGGSWSGNVTATLTAESTDPQDQGAILGVTLQLAQGPLANPGDPWGGEVATGWSGHEDMQLELDQYGDVVVKSTHCITVPFHLVVEPGEVVIPRLLSGVNNTVELKAGGIVLSHQSPKTGEFPEEP